MMERDPSLIEAQARASMARAELHGAIDGALAWFTPGRLKAEAAMAATQQIDEAKAALRRSARRNPFATWSAIILITTMLTYALRRPAAAGFRTAIDGVGALRKRLIRRKKKL